MSRVYLECSDCGGVACIHIVDHYMTVLEKMAEEKDSGGCEGYFGKMAADALDPSLFVTVQASDKGDD